MMSWGRSTVSATLTFCALWLVSSLVHQEVEAAEPRIYSIVGKAQLKVAPDRLAIVFDISFKGRSTADYLGRYRASYDQLLVALAPFDLSDQDVGVYGFRVTSDSGFWHGEMGSIEVRSSVTVTVSELGEEGDILAAIQRVPDVSRVRSVYSRHDAEKIRRKVDEMAVRDAVERTRSMAKVLGLVAAGIVSIGREPTEAELVGAAELIESASVNTVRSSIYEEMVFNSEITVATELKKVD